MSIAIASLLILVLLAVVAVPIVVRVVGVAGRRNENRPGGEEEEAGKSEEGRPGDEEMRREEEAIKSLGPILGGAMAVTGLLMGLAGGAFGISESVLANAVPSASMGIFLGITGYFLGARGLGRMAAIVSVAGLIFAMSAGQGYVPGLEPTDHGLPDAEPRSATN